MTFETIHAPVPPGALALDVWLEAEPDAELRLHLQRSLQPIGVELVDLDLARGSLWPLPVVTRVPASRLRIASAREVGSCDKDLIVSTLDAIGLVTDWSLVQRLDS